MNNYNVKSAQFIDTYFPIVDGVVQTVHNYATIMNERSYSCVVAPKGLKEYDDSTFPYDVFRSASIKVPIAEYSISAPKLDRKLTGILKEKDLEIFHAHSPFFEGTYASSLAKKLDIPCIATFHSKYYDDALNITGSKIIADIVVKKIVRFYNTCFRVWACSKSTAETLKSYGYKGEIDVVDNGSSLFIPADEREGLRERAHLEFEIPDGKKVLLFVGHLIWQKNLKLVLDTMKILSETSDEYHLIIAGIGYDGEKIKKYADSLNFPDGSVDFIGSIQDRNLLAGLYLNSDLFFFPSVYDNSPLVVREAASLGVPSLLTEGSNAAEAVRKNISGFTAPEDARLMSEEITKIFSPSTDYMSVAAAAEREIPKTWSSIVDTVNEKYLDIIKEYNKTKKIRR